MDEVGVVHKKPQLNTPSQRRKTNYLVVQEWEKINIFEEAWRKSIGYHIILV